MLSKWRNLTTQRMVFLLKNMAHPISAARRRPDGPLYVKTNKLKLTSQGVQPLKNNLTATSVLLKTSRHPINVRTLYLLTRNSLKIAAMSIPAYAMESSQELPYPFPAHRESEHLYCFSLRSVRRSSDSRSPKVYSLFQPNF